MSTPLKQLDYARTRLDAAARALQRVVGELRMGRNYANASIDGISTTLSDVTSALSRVNAPSARHAVGLLTRAQSILAGLRQSGVGAVGTFAPPALSPFGAGGAGPGAVTAMRPQGVALRVPAGGPGLSLQSHMAGPQAAAALNLVIGARQIVSRMRNQVLGAALQTRAVQRVGPPPGAPAGLGAATLGDQLTTGILRGIANTTAVGLTVGLEASQGARPLSLGLWAAGAYAFPLPAVVIALIRAVTAPARAPVGSAAKSAA